MIPQAFYTLAIVKTIPYYALFVTHLPLYLAAQRTSYLTYIECTRRGK
jgi:hypothetical protein